MQTIVTNNKEALVIGQLPNLGKDTAGVPQLGESVSFIPGVNLVKSEVLATLRKNPSFELNFKTKIESSPAPEQNPEKVGKFILVVGKEVEDKSPLVKLTEKACEGIITETFTSKMLRSWLDEEGRAEVRAMIERQLRVLETGAPAAAAGR